MLFLVLYLLMPSSDQDLSRFTPKKQPEFRETPMSLLDKAKKYAADSYEYAANEGGPVGKFLYSGGAEALKDIEQGTTPMVKTGRLPAMPTGAALTIFLFIAAPFGVIIPQADTATMLPVLMGMLGLGGLRSYEKKNGLNKW